MKVNENMSSVKLKMSNSINFKRIQIQYSHKYSNSNSNSNSINFDSIVENKTKLFTKVIAKIRNVNQKLSLNDLNELYFDILNTFNRK